MDSTIPYNFLTNSPRYAPLSDSSASRESATLWHTFAKRVLERHEAKLSNLSTENMSDLLPARSEMGKRLEDIEMRDTESCADPWSYTHHPWPCTPVPLSQYLGHLAIDEWFRTMKTTELNFLLLDKTSIPD